MAAGAPLAEQFWDYVVAGDLFPPDARLLVGLSGGVDSMVLIHLLSQRAHPLCAAHVNHQIRGAAADADEAFVQDYCTAHAIPLHVHHVDTPRHADAEGASLEATARDQRYAFFAEVAEAEACTHVAVAHHLDDQTETVLLNLFRGTGPEGLAGIPPQRPLVEGRAVQLVRPLLFARRAAIEAYAQAAGLTWRTDATNADLSYRRNALRHAILPLIEKHFGAAAPEKVAQAAALLQAYLAHSWADELAVRFAGCQAEAADPPGLTVAALQAQPLVWRQRILLDALRRWLPEAPQRAAIAEALDALLPAQPGRRVELKGGTVWRERGRLTFQADSAVAEAGPRSGYVTPEQPLVLPQGVLSVEPVDEVPDDLGADEPLAVYVDAARVALPLEVRPWQAGDRLQPLGMVHTKNVSDVLTDAKVPPSERSRVLVVCSAGTIVWVVGVRLAETAKVRPASEQVLRLSLRPTDAADM